MKNIRDFKLSLELRIDWSDLDMYQHVNNLTFMRFLQSGRVNFWEATGIHDFYQKTNVGTMLVSTNCDFKRPLGYPGTARVLTKLNKIGNTSFSLKHLVVDDARQICAEGLDTVVWYDFNKNATSPVPDWLKDTMSSF
ncbi:acyl-CoA thioesterase [Christiangramia portivictoriae]|uniref:acyl-CoA thioesterase n=1 Tax=Christiangramia portivictoriae TaxID=326069 RepID=UPI00047E7F03|nr:acyl-CoA thioesterase [Christiangramia portivictoriae]